MFLIVQKVEFVKNTYTPILHIAIFKRSEFSCFIPTNVKADQNKNHEKRYKEIHTSI